MKPVFALLFFLSAIRTYSHPGVGLVMDSRGNVYFTDLKQVWRLDPTGKKTVAVPHVHTHELYLDEKDNLYGEHLWYNGEKADTWGHYVWKLSAEGKFEKIIPDTEGFLKDFGFVHDGQGLMYWPDRETDCQKVIRKNADGSRTKLGDQCLKNIRWLTAGRDGTVYLTDFHDLKKIDPQGHVTTLVENMPDKKLSVLFVNEDHYLSGIYTDQADNIYVSDYSGRQVKKVTPSGKVSVVTETNLPWSPAATLVAPNGDFWVLENSLTNAVRVEKITPDGQRIIY